MATPKLLKLSLSFFMLKMSEDRFEFKLPALPWSKSSLEPFLSGEAITVHYNEHKNYVDKMNSLAREFPELQDFTLEEIVHRYTGVIQETAAQVVNHNFFWKCLSSNGGMPSGNLYAFIRGQFESFERFVQLFTKRALDHTGSGWVWLVFDPSTRFLLVVDGHDTYNPIVDGYIPLLALDIWEHSYFIDYRTQKDEYVNNFWKVVNWNYVATIARERIFGGEVL